MKRLIIYAIAAFAGVAMLASCDLNLVPNSAIAYEEGGVLIQTKADLNALENGILAKFRYSLRGDNGRHINSQEYQFDAFNASIDYGNNYGALHKSDYNFTSSDYDVEYMWENNYSAIKDYNIFIAASDNVSDDLKAATAVVKGEAFLFRAWSYLTLARQFGKAYTQGNPDTDPCVPLVLVYDQNELPARATVAQVYEQIGKDLDSAAVRLSDVKGAVRSQKPTIDAVNALYARYYLEKGDNANAAKYAHKVIDSGTYKLASSAEEMAAEYINDNGSEAIMQMAITMTEFTGTALNYWTLDQSDAEHGEAFRSYFLPTKTLIESYEASDLRLAAWYCDTVATMFAGSYYNVDKKDFYVFTKYWGNPSLTSTPIRNGRNAPKPFKINELYLIAAEAELAAGDAAAAKADLNALQAARGASATAANVDAIRKEWFRETVGEGMRKYCLKRWGVGFDGRVPQDGALNIVQQGDVFTGKSIAANSYIFQWPIPSHEMKINRNLEQNPGYDGK